MHMGCEQQLRCSAAVADCASTQPSRCFALVSEHPRVHMKCQCHRGHAAALLERLALQQVHRCHALLMGCRLRLRTSIQVVKQTGTLSSSAARQGQVQALRCCCDPQSASLTNENAVLALPGAFLGHRSFTQNPHLFSPRVVSRALQQACKQPWLPRSAPDPTMPSWQLQGLLSPAPHRQQMVQTAGGTWQTLRGGRQWRHRGWFAA